MSSDAHSVARAFSDVAADLVTADSAAYTVDEQQPAHVVKPDTPDQLSEILRSAHAGGLTVIPWGGGSQMGVGNVPSTYDVAIDLTSLDEVLRYDPDDMTMSVQCGARLQTLNDMLGEHRQVLPVDAAHPEDATIGGMTAVGASGPRRLGYGPLRDLIIGMSVMSVDGVIATAGGQVVKNVTGFDMMRMHHGALGSLGIILSVNLKVIPKPQSERTVIATYQSLEEADLAARAVVASQLSATAVVVTNPVASRSIDDQYSGHWAISVRCEAPPSAVVRQAERITAAVGDGATAVHTEESTEASVAHWRAVCRAMDQRGVNNEISWRIGQTASGMLAAGARFAELGDQADELSLTFDYGSGLIYSRVPHTSETESSFSDMHGVMTAAGNHVSVLTAPVSIKRGIDVFGGARDGFSMAQALKETFDPTGVLNPGRSLGRL
jgi:glycolate oxidase FAD binding subunit